jgi:hypothetical protein
MYVYYWSNTLAAVPQALTSRLPIAFDPEPIPFATHFHILLPSLRSIIMSYSHYFSFFQIVIFQEVNQSYASIPSASSYIQSQAIIASCILIILDEVYKSWYFSICNLLNCVLIDQAMSQNWCVFTGQQVLCRKWCMERCIVMMQTSAVSPKIWSLLNECAAGIVNKFGRQNAWSIVFEEPVDNE